MTYLLDTLMDFSKNFILFLKNFHPVILSIKLLQIDSIAGNPIKSSQNEATVLQLLTPPQNVTNIVLIQVIVSRPFGAVKLGVRDPILAVKARMGPAAEVVELFDDFLEVLLVGVENDGELPFALFEHHHHSEETRDDVVLPSCEVVLQVAENFVQVRVLWEKIKFFQFNDFLVLVKNFFVVEARFGLFGYYLCGCLPRAALRSVFCSTCHKLIYEGSKNGKNRDNH